MDKRNNSLVLSLAIAVVSMLVLTPFIGNVHLFDWDEINFAEAAREMLIRGNFSQVTINYQPFYEKPPLFFWFQAASMSVFGISEFAARFPNVLTGVATLVILFLIGRKLRDTMFGLLWLLAYGASILPFAYFQSGIIDPLFNLFMFIGIYFGFLSLSRLQRRSWFALLAGLFSGLSIMTKGPVGILIVAATLFLFWLLNFRTIKIQIVPVLIFIAFLLIVPGIWFGYETYQHGNTFIHEFLIYQVRLLSTPDAGHGGPFYYHLVVLLLGVFPASVFAIGSFTRTEGLDASSTLFRKLMLICFWFVLILFSIVKTKIAHYSSIAYFPISFLAALYLYKLVSQPEQKINIASKTGILFIGSLFGAVVCLLALLFGVYKDLLFGIITDPFALENLKADVNWTLADSLPGLVYVLCILCSFFIMIKPHRRLAGIILLFSSTLILSKITFVTLVPKIEGHSQRAAIEFYQQQAKGNAIVEVLGFKSYAHLFYGEAMPPKHNYYSLKDSLLSGNMDVSVYFVTKVHKAEGYKSKYLLSEIYRKNGFVFLKRED